MQQELATGFAVDIAYAGSHGIGLSGTIQLNQLPDELLKLGTALTQQIPNPFLGLVSVGTLSQPTVSQANSSGHFRNSRVCR